MPAAPLVQFFRRASRSLRGGGAARGARPELQAIPPSLRPVDDVFYAEWCDGRFALAGHAVALVDGSPFGVGHAPLPWQRALHGFGWLRHIPVSADADVEARVQDLVADWLARGKKHDKIAEADDVVARRVISWLAHTDLLLQTADAGFYDNVLQALMADIQTLERRWRSMPQTGPGYGGRLLALIALIQAGLCMAGADQMQHDAETALAAELVERAGAARNLFWREPDAVALLLIDLEALRLLYRLRFLAVPEFLSKAVERTSHMLGALSLGDGSVARLGSARSEPDAPLVLATVARHAGLPAVATGSHAATGSARLVHGATCVVADTGAPLASIHALAIEMSSGSAPLLVHDGLNTTPDMHGRGTLVFANSAATVTPNDASRRNTPTLEPTHSVALDVSDAATLRLDATHAGHARRGIAHRRRLTLDQNGTRLQGVDELRPLAGPTGDASTAFAARFVLHPSVSVALGDALQHVDLSLSNGHVWRFSAVDHALSVEGAVYRDGLRTLPTLQILVSSAAKDQRTITWEFARIAETSGDPAAMETAAETDPAPPRRSLADALAEVQTTPVTEPAVGSE